MFEVGKDIFKRGFSGVTGDPVPRQRLRIVYSVFVLAFIVFAFRTLWLGIQVTDRSRLTGSDGVWVAQRADIIDRNGDILAKNIMSGHITLRPQSVKDRDAVANTIHKALPYEYSLSDALDLVNSSRRFIYIKKYASDAQRNIIAKAKLQGLEIEQIQTRKYPKRRLFSHVVGFVGSDGHGLEGAERVYDKYLSENKDPLQLSLDARIQSVFYERLSFAMQKYQAKAAMGLLMNSVKLGLITALLCMLAGLFTALFIHNSQFRNRPIRFGFLLMAFVPSYIYALTWMNLLREAGSIWPALLRIRCLGWRGRTGSSLMRPGFAVTMTRYFGPYSCRD